jgi:hypothetical protein
MHGHHVDRAQMRANYNDKAVKSQILGNAFAMDARQKIKFEPESNDLELTTTVTVRRLRHRDTRNDVAPRRRPADVWPVVSRAFVVIDTPWRVESVAQRNPIRPHLEQQKKG